MEKNEIREPQFRLDKYTNRKKTEIKEYYFHFRIDKIFL
jgi:hypothetical protein